MKSNIVFKTNLVRTIQNELRWASTASAAKLQPNVSSITEENVQHKRVKPFLEMPTPRGNYLIRGIKNFLPIIGKYGDDLHTYKMDLYKEYGPIIREKFANLMVVHMFDPHDIEAYFRGEGSMPTRAPLLSLRRVRHSRPDLFKSGGLIESDGQEWYNLRRKFQQEMLRPKNVEHYIPSMDVVAVEFLNKLDKFKDKNNEVPELLNELYKWALETVGLVVFNDRLGCLGENLPPDSEAQKMISAVYDSFAAIHKLEFLSVRRFLNMENPKLQKQLQDAQEYIAKIGSKYVKKTMDWLKTADPHEVDREATLLTVFLLKDGVEHRDIISLINDVMFAAIDTTSHSIGFLLYLLCRNQDKQQRLYEEISKVFSTHTTMGTPLLNELRYLKACVKESMRIFPIVETNARTLEQPTVIRDYLVPEKVILLMHQRIASNVDENFDNPSEFRPERWLKSENNKPHHPFALLPFGHGARMCIGRRLAEQELFILTARILLRYRLEYHYEDIGTKLMTINRPSKPLRFSFIER